MTADNSAGRPVASRNPYFLARKDANFVSLLEEKSRKFIAFERSEFSSSRDDPPSSSSSYSVESCRDISKQKNKKLEEYQEAIENYEKGRKSAANREDYLQRKVQYLEANALLKEKKYFEEYNRLREELLGLLKEAKDENTTLREQVFECNTKFQDKLDALTIENIYIKQKLFEKEVKVESLENRLTYERMNYQKLQVNSTEKEEKKVEEEKEEEEEKVEVEEREEGGGGGEGRGGREKWRRRRRR
ncbi:trichoplein keratin filament-binding protein-like [Palaemon carinicauda]|uniref:trichoplein keratin filament-binding protein-like n=1 Tax=Palaemon carinicauda TaxID=392227 RepID=UPI0035B6097F